MCTKPVQASFSPTKRLNQTSAVDLHRLNPVVPAEALPEQLGEHIVMIREPLSDMRFGLLALRIRQ